jgi:glycosyltransferase involved in cell wall biosynthesis
MRPDGGPLFSIVTATFNRRAMLARALASAMRQGLDDVQHVVIDGASTDGTVEMLRDWPHLEWVSEPDRNLYDGWNKGLARARGAFVFILNSDDEVMDGAFDAARRAIRDNPAAEMISGPVVLTRRAGRADEHSILIDDPAMLALREQDIGPGVPLTNGRFLGAGLIARVGGFDIRYRAIADRQYFLRALMAGCRNVTVTTPIYRYHLHDGSLTLNEAGPSIAHAEECLRAAADGMAEATEPRLRAAYRRWHAWAAAYLAGLHARRGQPGAGLRVLGAGMAADPLLPLRLPGPVARHLRERRARAGRPFRAAA